MTQASTQPPYLADILVVDDTTANLQLLTGMLKERGYKVRPAPSGETALRAAQASPPDLILLDITMPGMDGYEVCSRLKADPRLREIPVLFISALDESEEKVRAFEVGGVDYVRKPFQLDEVDARVRAHLALRNQRRELQEAHQRLKELEQLRDSLTHMIAHDMKSPLLALRLSLDGLELALPERSTEVDELILAGQDSVTSLVEMIAQMLDVSRLESGQMRLSLERADLVELVREQCARHRLLMGERRLLIETAAGAEANADVDLVRRVIGNLLGNAIKFTRGSGEIRVAVSSPAGFVRVEVSDNGAGIPPEHLCVIFEKFAQVQGSLARLGTGLGLTFAKMAVEAHGGSIGVDSSVGQGSRFWFQLPA